MTPAELHAAVNDAAPALLAASALFDAASLLLRRDSLRHAAYWTLIGGLGGLGLAIGTGLWARGTIAHGMAIHAGMGTHQWAAYLATGWWLVIGGWRLARPLSTGPGRMVYVALALVGMGLVLRASHRGGHLVFRLGAGIPVEVHRDALADIAGGHEHAPGTADDHGAPSPDVGGPGDTVAAAAHEDAPGTPPHRH